MSKITIEENGRTFTVEGDIDGLQFEKETGRWYVHHLPGKVRVTTSINDDTVKGNWTAQIPSGPNETTYANLDAQARAAERPSCTGTPAEAACDESPPSAAIDAATLRSLASSLAPWFGKILLSAANTMDRMQAKIDGLRATLVGKRRIIRDTEEIVSRQVARIRELEAQIETAIEARQP